MLQLHNTLTNTKEELTPISKNNIGMYTCGPTVYHYVTIGNWRTYTLGDLVYRTLKYNNYTVDYIMNITDVGHLTGDNEGDANQGEDRMEKAKRREGKNAWEIAEFYSTDFRNGMKKLNLIAPKKYTKATDHIAEQIELVKKLEKNGLTYKIDDGIYFDVKKYETSGKTYGELSTIDQTSDEFSRIEPNVQKHDPRDFALWKFSPKDEQRDMEWHSPWGVGFPGWHIECSAMSMKYLGEQFDIHIGGEDLRQTHHPNEIAQAEGATGCAPFVKYWMHGSFLLVDGGKMGKSKGNAYRLQDIEERGFSPLDLRYFYLSGHYRHQINFTWEALQASQNALHKLHAVSNKLQETTSFFQRLFTNIDSAYKQQFIHAINDDLNMPEAVATVWKMIKDDTISDAVKYKTLIDFDRVLGLDLDKLTNSQPQANIPDELQILLEQRKTARTNKDWAESDRIRDEIKELGYEVKDTDEGQEILKI